MRLFEGWPEGPGLEAVADGGADIWVSRMITKFIIYDAVYEYSKRKAKSL